MLKKVLVANRGEIAVRIARACRALGISPVMVYSDADALALHTRSGDQAYHIGPSPASESYLRGDRIIEAALASGADAIHPGYGFLSESAEFARAVAGAGLIWVGPSPEAIALMGSKIESKRLASQHGVPLVPGYFGADQSDEALTLEAERLGFPLLVKASAGGGGKGMRVVESASQLMDALAAARREAAAAFGDDALMIEKYLTAPRHIEVQVLGDSYGAICHLGERDCTVQRRHQKVVEESPSPVLDSTMREAITRAAVDLARAAGYGSAGTVEFIFQDNEFYFLEMNTRIQVEHPVTEEALGVDLVQAQLRIAGGEPLSQAIASSSRSRHAFEARLYAEDPAAGFLPSTGKVTRLAFPGESDTIRVDAGLSEGDTVSPHYDPMIAKIIASGHDRTEALRNMRSALNELEVVGPTTNLTFLRWLFAQPEFIEGAFSTRFIDERYTAGATARVPDEVWLAAAYHYLIADPGSSGRNGPWTSMPWRQAKQQMPVTIAIGGESRTIVLSMVDPRTSLWEYRLEGESGTVGDGQTTLKELGSLTGHGQISVAFPEARGAHVIQIEPAANERKRLILDGIAYFSSVAAPLSTDTLKSAVHTADEDTLQSPMPGKVLKLLAGPGDQVEEDQALVIIEAMKMEFTVRAPHAGKVASIYYNEGDQVAVGDVLAEMEKPA